MKTEQLFDIAKKDVPVIDQRRRNFWITAVDQVLVQAGPVIPGLTITFTIPSNLSSGLLILKRVVGWARVSPVAGGTYQGERFTLGITYGFQQKVDVNLLVGAPSTQAVRLPMDGDFDYDNLMFPLILNSSNQLITFFEAPINIVSGLALALNDVVLCQFSAELVAEF